VNDNCGVASVIQSPAAGTIVFGSGLMTVTLTVTDINGNSTQCTFNVNKVDNVPPTIVCPNTQTVELGAGCAATLPNYTGLANANDNCGVASVTQSPAAGTMISGTGTVTVTLTATDFNGNTAQCSFTVNKVDTTPPTIACPATQNLDLEPNCAATLPDYTGLAMADDDCGVASVTQSPAPGTPVFGAGAITVTLTATDNNGNTRQCSFTVNKVDNVPPTITCPATQIVILNAQCEAALPNYTTFAITNDNCQVASVSQSPAPGTIVSVAGPMTVTLTVTDVSGNSTQCTFTVNKIDNIAPTIVCPAEQTLELQANCSTALPDYTGLANADDNCDGFSVTQVPAIGTIVSDKGTMTVTLTVTDLSGNTAQCSFTVNKVDVIPPTIACPAAQTRSTDTGVCTYTAVGTEFNPTSFDDNCPMASIAYVLSGATTGSGSNTLAGAVFQKGTTTVTWTVTDMSGNTAQCSFAVTVNDNEPPTIACPAAQTRSANTGVCTYTAVGTEFNPTSFGDNCPMASIAYVLSGATTGSGSNTLAGAVFQKGTTTVTWTVTDMSGNSAQCSFAVTVNDNEPPTIACPSNQTRSTNAGVCTYTAVGAEFNPTSFGDNCPMASIAYVLSGATTGSGSNTLAGAVFQKGTTTVTWTVTDMSGNSAQCSFAVTVNDTEPPTIACPSNQTRSADDDECFFTAVDKEFDPISFGDNCPMSSISYVLSGATTGTGTGTLDDVAFNKGTTTVTWTVTDMSGNTAVCSFTVTVNDNELPTIACPANQTRNTTAGVCTYTATGTEFNPTSFGDNCPMASIAYVLSGATSGSGSNTLAGVAFNKGTTTVTWTVTDMSGNTAQCGFTVVVNDVELPTIACPANQTRSTNTGVCTYTAAGAEFNPTSFGDNCPMASIAYVLSGATTGSGSNTLAGAVFQKGTTTVTWTVTDMSGNSAQCSFTVTVNDTELPTIVCPGTQVLPLDDFCSAMLPDYTGLASASDNCGMVTVTQSPMSGMTVNGATPLTVTLTVTDAAGNSAQCSFTVNFTDDTPPSVTCSDQTITFTGQATIMLDPLALVNASDACGIQSIVLTPSSVSCADIGQTIPVTALVTDNSGNTATCTSNVTLEGLPCGWSSGSTGCTGTATFKPAQSEWSVTSQNCYYDDPFDSDSFAYVQRTLCGNGSITARVTNISPIATGWAGVIMRETNSTGTKKVQLMTNLNNLSRREVRYTTGGQAYPQQFPAQSRFWLRIERIGNQFIGYVSGNGVIWIQVMSVSVDMNSCIQMGLVVTNYSPISTVTATFNNVSFTGSNVPLLEGASTPLSTHEQPTADFSVFPNPTSGLLNVGLSEYIGRPVRVELYSLQGQLLRFAEIDEVQTATEQFDLSGYKDGMYLVRVKSEGLPDATKRVVLTGLR
jgi:large repetitive protein